MTKTGHVKRIPHITLGASDIKKAVSFYEEILGLEKIGEWPAYAIFDIAGVELGLQPRQKPEICLLVDDVDKAYGDLKDKGVKFLSEPKDQDWGGRAATFVDPDGNIFVIESFQCRVCGKFCETYRELLEEHLKKHKSEP
jgi:catechol 2,3-dioxygenase-like lactoylglutathione lyase family enzyme